MTIESHYKQTISRIVPSEAERSAGSLGSIEQHRGAFVRLSFDN